MLAKKNLASGLAALAVLVLGAGCTPAGPQALLTGRKLLESGDAAAAVEKFKLATSLMSSNAQAWNYLGLAAHQAGQATQAVAAYQQAIKLDRDFVEARFNLGCLLADQGRTSLARDAFAACTVLRPAYPEAWLRRAQAEMQLKEYGAAESSLRELLRQNPAAPEALNALGLVQLQRNRPRDAAQSFAAALKAQPGHPAALLNLAIITHQQFNDRPAALTLYRQYLALNPRRPDWEAVNSLAQSLQPPPAPGAIPPQSKPAEPATPMVAPNLKPVEPAPRPVATAKPEPPVTTAANRIPSVSNPPPQVVKLPPEPVIRSTPVDSHVAPPAPKAVPPTNAVVAKKSEATPDNRGLLSRVFHKDPKPAPRPTPLPAETGSNPPPAGSRNPVTSTTSAPAVTGFARYEYASPALPAAGNARECERLLAQGRREQDSRKFAEAVQSYRAAVAADPSNFDAQFALGYAAFQLRSYKLSTWAWEYALAIHPDSADARYNFALALRAMNCVPDAARELEKVLRSDDTMTKAHLTLGSIYADQLKDPARARLHYRRVLDLEPSHPRGAEIRQWLMNNKP